MNDADPATTPAPATADRGRPTRAPRPLPAAAFARLVLILAGTLWLAVGVPGLLDPQWLSDLADIRLPNTLALYEFRAQWGGLSLAIAALHYVAATRRGYLVPGLLASLLLDIGLSAGRITSLALDPGLPGVVGLVFLGIEAAMMALLAMALWRIGKLSLAERRALREAARASDNAPGKLEQADRTKDHASADPTPTESAPET